MDANVDAHMDANVDAILDASLGVIFDFHFGTRLHDLIVRQIGRTFVRLLWCCLGDRLGDHLGVAFDAEGRRLDRILTSVHLAN